MKTVTIYDAAGNQVVLGINDFSGELVDLIPHLANLFMYTDVRKIVVRDEKDEVIRSMSNGTGYIDHRASDYKKKG